MDWRAPCEYILVEIDAGDCVIDGGSDWKKDAGEEGGATKGRITAVVWVWL